MKKLLVLALYFPLLSFSATTGTLVLQGTIPSLRSLTVTPEAGHNTLDLGSTQTDLKVATVNEKSNSILGYKITIVSANLSNLKRVSGTEVIPYTLKYNGLTADVSSITGYSVTHSGFPVNVNKDLTISYTGVDTSLLTEGNYSDTLTLTISSP